MTVPKLRIQDVNQVAVNADGRFVLYWMTAFRRPGWNFSLQRAVEHARELKKPLVVLETLRTGYQWASDRMHHFAIQGMADNARAFEKTKALYYPYVEPETGDGEGLLEQLANHACVVVTDDFPCLRFPEVVALAAEHLEVRLEKVDSNGLLPLRAADRVFLRAYDFRRFLQQALRDHLDEFPEANPLSRSRIPESAGLPSDIRKRWPPTDVEAMAVSPGRLLDFPIDHSVAVTCTRGGIVAANKTLDEFLQSKLPVYGAERNQPDHEVTSGLSPFLHFGHISTHDVFARLMQKEDWTAADVADRATGSAADWWGVGPGAESFLDELITWREIGFNMCWQREDYDQFESLPEWAQRTLEDHVGDQRPAVYSLAEFEAAATHDPLWNAAQTQLVREGRIHNYLRMLWGKKILHWTETPQMALEVMIQLNNKYAIDGRNPNSYSGIFWVLGRYDRAWGPEREVFGKVRYMTSRNTARKFRVKPYVEKFGPSAGV